MQSETELGVSPSGNMLETRVRSPTDLTSGERTQMLQLMLEHYDNITPDYFLRDLAEKEWVITTADPVHGVVGFTTLSRISVEVNGKQVVALYSGDTAFAPAAWGSSSWVRVWGRHATKVVKDLNQGPIPWLLLTATHRTFQFLPTFFKSYYPCSVVETPTDIQACLDALVWLKFPAEYDSRSGLVRLLRPTPVKKDRVEIASAGIDDPIARFFAERNPGYLNGDYLACITFLSPENYTRLGRKLFLDKPI